MTPRLRVAALAVASAVALLAVGTAGAAVKSNVSLDYYGATVSTEAYQELLATKDLDITSAKTVGSNVQLTMVLSTAQASALRKDGISVSLVRNKAGRTARQEAAFQKSTGYNVWIDYDGSDGMAAEMKKIARQNPDIASLEVIGRTTKGRIIWGIKLTDDANWRKDGKKPAVLYSSTQHAREWIAAETNRRLLHWYIDQYRAKNKSIRKLLDSTELWFVLVANPDGYQYTFQSPDTRLWRKTLRDNNGNGTIEVGDGVDPNRNYPEHWNYDNEGSSGVQSSDTWRGPSPGSEPETKAIINLLQRIGFSFQVNYHSFGPYLLTPEGWQTGTPTADDPIYYALTGNKDNPAIPGSFAGLSSDVLYVTNGETTDYAHVNTDTLAWTPELGEGTPGSGFVFPDDEALAQAEFENQLAFATDVAKSAKDPSDPVSHLGIETKPFYLESDDTYKAGLPLASFKFAVSYGDPQEVRINALRELGKVELKYRINGGSVKTASTSEWKGGEKYGATTDVYYHIVRGFVKGTKQGDSVQVWFEEANDKGWWNRRKGGRNAAHHGSKPGAKSESFTYTVAKKSNNKVLVVAAEDYTGASPVQTPGPHYLNYYLDALAANGYSADVYDVDAMGRKAPDALGVLSHYKAVIWYTGDDTVTRPAGGAPGTASRLAMDELFEARDYLNEGGRILYSGKNAGLQYTTGLGAQRYDPTGADGNCADPAILPRCLILYGSPSSDLQNDTIEYWFGAYLTNLGAGLDADGNPFGIVGVNTPFISPVSLWTLNGGDGADNQTQANSFITTSGILPAATYPQFESSAVARYDRPGGPFDPRSGANYVYSQIADVSYKRLTKTFTVPAAGGEMSFWTSYNTEPDWDFLFVEIRTAGQNNWTTLPDLNGNTGTAPGQSCASGWNQLHPFIDHYQTFDGVGACTSTGSSGSWNAASGDSHGWQQWRVNVGGPYAGQQVEVSITYASDWATQGLGVFVDDISLPDGTSTSFEAGLDGWTIPGQPAGSAPNTNDFIRTAATGFPEGAVVSTPDTLYMGFGFEGITSTAQRNDVMKRSMKYLLRP